MVQLGTDGGIRRVSLPDGAMIDISDTLEALDAGNHSFGIGYDADASVLGIGRYNAGQMIFLTYDFTVHAFTSTNTFGFDTSLYGNPRGLDFKIVNGESRMIVGTRDGPAEDIFSEPRNFVMDMTLGGEIGQYFVTSGNIFKLEDMLVDPENNSIALGYSGEGGGRVEVGEFNVIPEPSTVLLLLFGMASAALARRKIIG